MAVNVFPEDGDTATAAAAAELFDAIAGGVDYVFSGFVVSDGGSLVASVAAGVAVLGGVVVTSDAAQTTTLANNTTNYVHLESDGTVSDNTTGTVPSGGLRLATVVTSGGSISSISHIKNVENARCVFIVKASDETVNNSATVQDDDELQFAVLAGQKWQFQIALFTNSPNTGASDFRYTTNQSVGLMQIFGGDREGYATLLAVEALNVGSEGRWDLSSSVTNPTARIGGAFVAEADGNFIFKWSQWSAVAHDTIVKAGSFLVARRILG